MPIKETTTNGKQVLATAIHGIMVAQFVLVILVVKSNCLQTLNPELAARMASFIEWRFNSI